MQGRECSVSLWVLCCCYSCDAGECRTARRWRRCWRRRREQRSRLSCTRARCPAACCTRAACGSKQPQAAGARTRVPKQPGAVPTAAACSCVLAQHPRCNTFLSFCYQAGWRRVLHSCCGKPVLQCLAWLEVRARLHVHVVAGQCMAHARAHDRQRMNERQRPAWKLVAASQGQLRACSFAARAVCAAPACILAACPSPCPGTHAAAATVLALAVTEQNRRSHTRHRRCLAAVRTARMHTPPCCMRLRVCSCAHWVLRTAAAAARVARCLPHRCIRRPRRISSSVPPPSHTTAVCACLLAHSFYASSGLPFNAPAPGTIPHGQQGLGCEAVTPSRPRLARASRSAVHSTLADR